MKVLRVYHAGRDAAHRERDRALVAAGAELTLVVPSSWPGADDPADAEPFDVIELPVRRPGDVNRHTYADPDAITALIERLRPDLLDLHEEPFSSVVHQLMRRLPHRITTVAYTAQNIDKRFPPPFAWWERAALTRLDGLYPCTRQAASVVVGKGFRGPVEVLPLAPSVAMTRGDQQLPTDELRLLHVGRLVPEKGVRDAIEAFATVAHDRHARLTIVGSGPEAEPARELAAHLGIDDVVDVRPWAGPNELAELYRRTHVLLAPSRRTRTWVEQFGRMCAEAQAAGAVVIGYATGSLPEVVDDAGVLVPEGDTAALAHAVLSLAREPQRWTQLREAGFAAARDRTWDAVAAGQLRLYERALQTAPFRGSVRPQRRHATAMYGVAAPVAGGGRPFALPVLRTDNLATRSLARVADAASRSDARPDRDRMKVVYLDHVARMSGGEVALARLLGALPDVDAHVILAEDGPLRSALERAGATVEVLPLDPRTRDVRRAEVGTFASARAAATTLGYSLRIARRLRQLRPDLVHTNSLKSGYYGSIAARVARLPVIWHLRDRLADDYLPGRAVRLSRFAVRHLPDLVVCNSAETLREARLGEDAAAVVASPVVYDPYEGPDPTERSSRATTIGILGRLAPWKGQDVFLRAFAQLALEAPEVHARVIGSAMFGEDEYAASLPELADRLGVADRVTFVGYTDEVEQELRRLDVLVHASVTPEPFGQVIVEGMAAGLAVVASAAGGPVEIVTDGVNGLLVPPGDVAALTAALLRLVGDDELRQRLAAAGIVRAADFAPDQIGQRMGAIYRAVLASRR